MTIAKCLRDNKSIVRFGIHLEIRCPRVLVTEYVQRNNDNSECFHSYEVDSFCFDKCPPRFLIDQFCESFQVTCAILVMLYSAYLKMHPLDLSESNVSASLSGSYKALHECSDTCMLACTYL